MRRPRSAAKNDRWPQPVVDRDVPNEYARRPCSECGESKYYLYPGEPCFDCSRISNPYAGSGPLVLIDAGGEDTPHPARIADGTSHLNLGLPPVNGRPVTHHELANNHGVREYAKRHGLEPMTKGRYRGLR